MLEVRAMAASTSDPAADGWTPFQDVGFIDLVGPIWQRREGNDVTFAFRAEPKHENLIGVVQGGMLMTFADRTLGAAAWAAAGGRPSVTVQFDHLFISSAKIGEWVEVRPEVVRQTSSLIFMRGTLTAGDRTIGSASGVWKILTPR